MPSFLGYDRELLTLLRTAMRRSSDELAVLGSTDHDAADAVRVLRASRVLLDDQWLPVLDGLLACVALDERNPVRLDRADLRTVLLFDRQLQGWQITSDPLPADSGPDGTPTSAQLIEEARAIGAGLVDDTVTDVLTMDELVWLADHLQAIAANPAAAAALREAIGGEDGWVTLFDRLGLDRLDAADALVWDPDDDMLTRRVAAIDAALVPVAAVYATTCNTSKAPWYPAVIAQLDPYSAALLLSTLDLSPGVAALAADQILSRWIEGSDDGRMWADPFAAGDNGADLLFRWLAQDADASRLFIARVSSRPELLFRTAHDDAALTAVLVAGTDPSTTPVDEAGRAIRHLLDWAMEHDSSMSSTTDGGVDNIRLVLATVVSPWLMQLTGRTTDWKWSSDDAEQALRWVIEDDEAAARMLTSMGAWQLTLATTSFIDADGRLDLTSIDELAELFASLLAAIRDQDVSDAVAAAFWASASYLVLQIVVSAFVPGGAAVAMTVDATLAALGPITTSWLADHGMGTNDDATVESANVRFGSRAADAQVIAVVAVVGQMIALGLVPPDSLDRLRLDDIDDEGCTPQVVDDQITAFIEGLRDTADPVAYNGLIGVARAFANAQSIEAQC